MKTYYAENELKIGCRYAGGEPCIPYTSIEEAKAHYIDFFKEKVMCALDEQGEDIENFYEKDNNELTKEGKEKIWQYIEEHCHPHFVCKELPDYIARDLCFSSRNCRVSAFPGFCFLNPALRKLWGHGIPRPGQSALLPAEPPTLPDDP